MRSIEECKNSLKCLVMEPDFCENQVSCDQCPLCVPCYAQSDTVADALQYIEHLEGLVKKQNEDMKELRNVLENIIQDSKELIARINAGEDVMVCDYCKKNFGSCNCNCLKDFEWRGLSGIMEKSNNVD